MNKINLLFFVLIMPAFVFSQSIPKEKITIEEYIEIYKETVMQNMIKYHIPASITMAQGILESGFGNSELAIYANNHFGIKCHKNWEGEIYSYDDDKKNECFRKYKNSDESYKDHSLFLTSKERYKSLFELEIIDYKAWARGLKEAGYATNPKYALRLITIIEQHKLYEIDKLVVNDYPNIKESVAIAMSDNQQSASYQKTNDEISIKFSKRFQGKFNGIRFTIAKEGDTYKTIAVAFDMMPWQILKYNDINKSYKINAGDKIYLQPKKNKSKEKFHIVSEGESMRYISQKYGIKLKKLYRYNDMKIGVEPVVKQKIHLNSACTKTS